MATLAARISALATSVGNYIRDNVLPRLLPAGGTTGQILAKSSATNYSVGWVNDSSDPWTRVGLAADAVNATVTFADLTGFTFTPAANVNWTVEAEVLLETVAVANMPLLKAVIGAGQAWWAGEISFQSTATADSYLESQGTTGAGAITMVAGTAVVQAIPILCQVKIKGRSGASPGAIKLQIAAEIAAANACTARRGSEFRSRTGP